MAEPIKWIYQAGTGCKYCKEGLCGRMNELMEQGYGINAASKIMEKECESEWKWKTIGNLFGL